jgi:hypothetical protein
MCGEPVQWICGKQGGIHVGRWARFAGDAPCSQGRSEHDICVGVARRCAGPAYLYIEQFWARCRSHVAIFRILFPISFVFNTQILRFEHMLEYTQDRTDASSAPPDNVVRRSIERPIAVHRFGRPQVTANCLSPPHVHLLQLFTLTPRSPKMRLLRIDH